MPSRATCPIADPSLEARIAACEGTIAELERRLWANGFDESVLERYQAAFRDLEDLIAARGVDDRHGFVVVIAVADRPRQLQECLESLLELCQAFGYGGRQGGRWRKVRVLIADDSNEPASIAAHEALARRYSELGLEALWYGAKEQKARLAALGERTRAGLAGVVGEHREAGDEAAFGHKGQGAMRNIAALELLELAHRAGDERLLFHAVDSDQEFKVKVATRDGDRDVCAVSFFHRLDQIFRGGKVDVLTGKVVGDPPVSPAVMTSNFLDDVAAFLREAASGSGGALCPHHDCEPHREGEAAYHDMADLFGFRPPEAAYRYQCPLRGEHAQAACFSHFAGRLDGFFYGEHPTRVSRYVYEEAAASVRPARTVYVGNYVCRPGALEYFIPFASLRLRMSGPTLGRIIQSEIGARFVSANLPMLHKRTLTGTAQSEFRPGVERKVSRVDLSGEFERQFYGDVMLFSMERLTAAGFSSGPPQRAAIAEVMETVRAEMLERYNERRRLIADRLRALNALLHDPAHWWNQAGEHRTAVAAFEVFAANVDHNFGSQASGYARINSSEGWTRWREKLVEAVAHYPDDRHTWREALGRVRAA